MRAAPRSSSLLVVGCAILAHAAAAFAQPQPDAASAGATTAEEPCASAPEGMVCVPGGQAVVGVEHGGRFDLPRRIVAIGTFYLDVHEVTHAQYRACVQAGACAPLLRAPGPQRPFVGDDQPALPVDYARAERFCAWVGKRLPTEFEWEKAARGSDGELYPWGNDAPTCKTAQFQDCAPRGCVTRQDGALDCPGHGTRGVHALAPARYGVVGLVGNAPEWTSTWYASWSTCGAHCSGRDPRGPCDGNPECPGVARKKVVRGASWYAAADGLLSSTRRPEDVDSGTRRIGFRCASSPAAASGPHPLATPNVAPPGEPVPTPLLPPQETTPSSPGASTPPATTQLTPPGDAERAIAADIVQDDLAKQICAAQGRAFVDCRDPAHYIRSNEARQHVWHPFLEDLGGGYTGVGIDQNYTFMAHAKSTWGWLFDYDPTVVRLHRVLRALILDAPTRADFLAHFDDADLQRSLQVLDAAYADDPDRAALREVFQVARAKLYPYYKLQIEQKIAIPDITKAPGKNKDGTERARRTAGVRIGDPMPDPDFGWLATDDAYAYIRMLYQQGRIILLKGDMLSSHTMQGIAAAAKKLGVTIRIYYPSNAAESWAHTRQYKSNVRALPFDDKTIVLQSFSGTKTGFGKQIGYWHYNVQAGLLQQQLMGEPGHNSARSLVNKRARTVDPDLTTSGVALPPPVKRSAPRPEDVPAGGQP